MNIKVNIRRFNPEKGQKAFYQTYDVDVPPKETVLNVLLKIRNEEDQTLGLRCSCRSAICGSCAMKINGQGGLACNTQVEDVVTKKGEIRIDPPGNMRVIRDLIVDFTDFWKKVKSVTPWLEHTGPDPKREHLCSNDDMLKLSHVTECIMCGSCVSDCTVMEVDKNFLGPAALAKAFRFVDDPRDGIDDSRLAKISEYGGIWDCTHCFKCVEACPKKVLPMDRILALRKIAMEKGFTDNTGSRHSAAIMESVEHSGTLNELTVMPKSHGWWNIPEMLSLIPAGMRMMKHHKMPKLIHPKLPDVENVTKIFKKFKKK
ncbi:MAG TPA: succinate dehydrogenase iron-sulfur subunit [Spirochaetes bacterium]|nr:succinate dehydrogenase iron-sulfur subunit [Spirochaetota bacterium]